MGLALNYGILTRSVVLHNDSTLTVSMGTVTDKFTTVCLNERLDLDQLQTITTDLLREGPTRTIDLKEPILMLVACCSDELLFGAPYLLLSQSEIIVAVLTTHSLQRKLELQSIAAKIQMDGGRVSILNLECDLLVDSYWSSNSRQIRSMAGEIALQTKSMGIARVVTYDEKVEHGHPHQKLVHSIGSELASVKQVPLEFFRGVWDRTIHTLTEEEQDKFRLQRQRLLRNYESLNYEKSMNIFDLVK